MYAELLSAAESVKTLGVLLKTANSLANYNEIVAAMSEVNAKLMQANTVALAAQEKQAFLANRIRELEEKITRYETWQATVERYALQNIGSSGSFGYALKDGVETLEPFHYICKACYDKRIKSTLDSHEDEYATAFSCSICNHKIFVPKQGDPPIHFEPDRY